MQVSLFAFAVISLLGSGLLLYVHILGGLSKAKFPTALSSVPAIFCGITILFSAVYFLTMISLYFNEISGFLHYCFLLSIFLILYLARRSEASLCDRDIVESCIILFCFVLFILLYQFYPYDYLSNHIPRENFQHHFHIDYVIPLMFADSLLRGELLTFGDWLGSDRPPLFSGAILFLNISSIPLEAVYLPIGIILNCLIIPVITESIASLSGRKLYIYEKFLCCFVVISSPIFVHNVAFLWPKIFSAMFMIIAMHVLFFPQVKTVGLAVVASISMLLAMLSHGGSGFAIVSLAFIYIIKVREVKSLYRGVVIGAVFIAGYMPWMFYQKIVQPPGDRLIKWQLLGQIGIVPEGVGEVFLEKYQGFNYFDIPVRIFLSFKNQFWDGFSKLVAAPSADSFANISFYHLPLSVGGPFVVALTLLVLLKDKKYKSLISTTAVSVIVWFALPFMPVSSIHEGPYFIPFILILTCLYGVINLHFGKIFITSMLVVSGMVSMAIMDMKRDKWNIFKPNVYRIDSTINYYGGGSYTKENHKGLELLGSYITSDADIADFTLTAVDGDIFYYITGPSAIGQQLLVYGDGQLILELNENKYDRWESMEVGEYSQLQIRLIDEGKGWGEWSAISVGK
jgi:hypothetical protein